MDRVTSEGRKSPLVSFFKEGKKQNDEKGEEDEKN